ncbi:uncharacterized protein AruCF_3491 [Achromobacter ruhlandii]|nr:uncharacterized protein AruCF_3491 [Achromobacter ruhlandii]
MVGHGSIKFRNRGAFYHATVWLSWEHARACHDEKPWQPPAPAALSPTRLPPG